MELRLQEHVVQASLIVLPMPEFDIILGMDWLSQNGASIDFRRRSVSVRPPRGEPFIFEATRNKKRLHLISCISARKLMMKGCQGVLANVILIPDAVGHKVEDVEVVREFPNVFPEDVSGIPPKREVEFSIELIPGTVPISKAPYRLAPAEMKELKDHIQ
ncbi:uncharacterized protein LOC121991588 [Zingiber officinale]|uniref:uncharacterized protein LOC121991588 n=1 Tax=Zingiber officinale TaxID=94328 RepID=UPI001C4DC928|nr:uncharacterized protein LOC121991588 [Zingiber officinale]